MFKGNCFTLKQVNRDRFELISPYTHRVGSFTEIQKHVSVYAIANAAERRELLAMQEQLKQTEDAEAKRREGEVLRQRTSPPRLVSSRPEKASPVPKAPAVVERTKRAPHNHVNVVDLQGAKKARPEDGKKRRTSGRQLLQQLAAG